MSIITVEMIKRKINGIPLGVAPWLLPEDGTPSLVSESQRPRQSTDRIQRSSDPKFF